MERGVPTCAHCKLVDILKCGACRVYGDWWTDISNKNGWFQKHKDYPTVKYGSKENGNEGNINIPNAPDEKPVNEENLLNLCRISFKFLDQGLRYDQYHFQNKLWSKNEMLQYLRTCCFSKNVAFNAIEVFQHRARVSWIRYLATV